MMSKPTSIHRDWKTVALGEVLTKLQYGTSMKATANKQGVPVLRMGNIQNGRVVTDELKYLDPPKAELERYRLVSGDILINRTNSAELVGKAGVFDLNGEYVFASYLIRLQVNRASADPAFVNYAINSGAGQAFLKSTGKASIGQSNINTKQIRRMPLVLPPIPEQQRIVARVESLISRSQKLRELNASLVKDMTRLLYAEYTRITEKAPTKNFSDVAKLVRRAIKTKPDELYQETGIRSFGKGTFHKPALTGKQLGNKRIFRIKAGDLVFMNVFAWEGAIAMAQPEDDGRVASHRFMMHEAQTDSSTAEFLCYHFLTERGLEQIRGASPGSAGRNRTLGIAKLHSIPVPVPPINEQRRFSKLYLLKEKLRRLQLETETELNAFTPALLAKAFRGEL
jgi:type I restriction enzyme S subunit